MVLSEGIFLPHISSFTYTDVNIVIHKVRNKIFNLLPAMFDLKRTREQCSPPGLQNKPEPAPPALLTPTTKFHRFK